VDMTAVDAAVDAATPDQASADSADSSPPPNPAIPLSSAPQRRRPVRRRTSRRRAITAPLGALVATAACLVLAFIGYQLSGTGHGAGPSAASGGSAPLHAGANSPAGGQGPGARPDSRNPDTQNPPMEPASTAGFVVFVSTTNFRKATLQEQVRQQLSTVHDTGSAASPGPSGSAGSVKHSAGVTPATGGDRCIPVEVAGWLRDAPHQPRPARAGGTGGLPVTARLHDRDGEPCLDGRARLHGSQSRVAGLGHAARTLTLCGRFKARPAGSRRSGISAP